jgi:DNA-binding response OmpR family regulator
VAALMKILVVEDDRKLAQFVQRVLAEAGLTADICADGAQALAQVAVETYDAVLLDWTLPGMDGLELCREVRRRGLSTPVMMISARERVEQRVLALESGADDYLVKPFKMAELVARVRALLRRTSPQPRVTLGLLEIDYFRRTATADGKAIDTTARELSLLVHLAHKGDQIVSRTELLSQVWETGFDPESNIVDVHVSRLRKKLGDLAWMLETVRGRGYRLRTRR